MERARPGPPDRRRFLRLAAASGLGGLLLACGAGRRGGGADGGEATATPPPLARAPRAAPAAPARPPSPTPTPPAPPAFAPTPAPTAYPPFPAGSEERLLMRGTEWETPLFARHSGADGPIVLVLGGVHGNEPGGWIAAEAIAGWTPRRGSLVVAPRANLLATRAGERTLPELGDLNRLYPGARGAGLPMARMAAEIVEAARAFRAELALDLHESWGFYAERGGNRGTAFIGQTITSGPGAGRLPVAADIARAFNAQVEGRDRLIARDWSSFGAAPAGGAPPGGGSGGWRPGRGGSSLSLGLHVPGLTPVLIEMGQQRQAVGRRAELHRLAVRVALEARGML